MKYEFYLLNYIICIELFVVALFVELFDCYKFSVMNYVIKKLLIMFRIQAPSADYTTGSRRYRADLRRYQAIFHQKWAEKRAHLRQKWADIGAWGGGWEPDRPQAKISAGVSQSCAICDP